MLALLTVGRPPDFDQGRTVRLCAKKIDMPVRFERIDRLQMVGKASSQSTGAERATDIDVVARIEGANTEFADPYFGETAKMQDERVRSAKFRYFGKINLNLNPGILNVRQPHFFHGSIRAARFDHDTIAG